MQYLQRDGQYVTVRGYVALSGVESLPLQKGGTETEILMPGCFDPALWNIGKLYTAPHLQLNHAEGLGICAEVRVWRDSIGIAFESKPLPLKPINLAVANGIVCNSLRGVSWEAVISKSRKVNRGGRIVNVVEAVQYLAHICVTGSPAYPEAACWLSTESTISLPYHLPALARAWEIGERA